MINPKILQCISPKCENPNKPNSLYCEICEPKRKPFKKFDARKVLNLELKIINDKN